MHPTRATSEPRAVARAVARHGPAGQAPTPLRRPVSTPMHSDKEMTR
jgi:hypothetical protein